MRLGLILVLLGGCTAEFTGDGGNPDSGGQSPLGGGNGGGTSSGTGGSVGGGTGYDAGQSHPTIDAGPLDVQLTVNTAAERRPISRYIYGKNSLHWSTEAHLTLNRLGGNRWTAYNWENNASNAGSDYMFHNDGFLGGADVAGEAVRGPVAQAQTAGGATLVTIPIAGYVAADKQGTSVTGQSLSARFKRDVARKSTAFTYPPVLTDDAVYQDEFVSWLEQRFPAAHQSPEKEIFYALDNEPDLWSATHSEIHPSKVTYAELVSLSVDYAKSIKRVAPTAKVFGAVSYGFNGYLNLQDATDAANRDFIEFFLESMRAASTTAGVRLLDVLDLHWYPEATGGGMRVTGEQNTPAVVAARVQTPRSLWDPTYVETSWISDYLSGQPLQLIPLLLGKIAAKYPDTKLAFSEYYFGGGAHISGAVAQADALGVFGREGVWAATLWPMSSDLRFVDAGFRAYRNFDGAGSNFADTSVQATTSDVAAVTVYASADDTNGRVVIVAINKTTADKKVGVQVDSSATFTSAQPWQVTAASPSPVRQAALDALGPNFFALTLPAMSVTTLALKP
jgi:Glycoside hydrolase family 44